MTDGRTIVFFPEGAYGPTNNCIGIGDVLRRRGHRVVFIVEESFAGNLEKHGFEERLMRLGPPPAEPEVPGQFWKDFIRETAPEFRKPTIEQLTTFLQPTWQALIDGARYVEPRLREIFAEVRPDAIVEDNVVAFPAVVAADAPWARITSCNPAELLDDAVPPVFSGYPSDDRAGWAEFREAYGSSHGPMWGDFDTFVREAGAAGLADDELGPRFIHESPFLNLYLYPAEADYRRTKALAPTWHRLDSCVRSTDGSFDLPDHLRPGVGGRDGALIYLSLGSLGAADVELMQRLVDVLGQTRHRVIVSKGPQADLIDLHDNMWGQELVPQPAILPQVDLVITHGGNNTTTECFQAGKPMIALPLFWDQYDNATRIDELGFGRRLATYAFEDRELTDAIEAIAGDESLRTRMSAISTRLRAAPGTVRAADLVERLARTGRPVVD
ncbi:MAG TPA: nucleotide disphospho-sugar-binding domain-containing protein [Candidatus Limnocylindrales bacterium]|nr:nucleotide disphospho-sugar-binding domain-containing protein [Candidatus Limnocylindrales bacterium]